MYYNLFFYSLKGEGGKKMECSKCNFLITENLNVGGVNVKKRYCYFNKNFRRLQNWIYECKLYLEHQQKIKKKRGEISEEENFCYLFSIEELELMLEIPNNYCEFAEYLQRFWNEPFNLLIFYWLRRALYYKAMEEGIMLKEADPYDFIMELKKMGFG